MEHWMGYPPDGGPWWMGFNDGQRENEYNNTYWTVTAKYEYQCGFTTGATLRESGTVLENLLASGSYMDVDY